MKLRLFAPALLAAAVVLASVSTITVAHEFTLGAIRIAHPQARATVPGQPAGAAYIGLENTGKTPDTLLRASSPVAKSVELHTMSMENNVMKMREVGSIALAPGAKVEMKPGDGFHIMLMGLQQPLKVGDKFPLTLEFEKAGKLEVVVHVEDKHAKPMDGKAKGSGDAHMHHKH